MEVEKEQVLGQLLPATQPYEIDNLAGQVNTGGGGGGMNAEVHRTRWWIWWTSGDGTSLGNGGSGIITSHIPLLDK